MSDIRVHTSASHQAILNDVEHFATQWSCEWKEVENGILLLPEYMLRIYGVFIIPEHYGWKLFREEEATTWEDYLQVKLAHELAMRNQGTVYYENRTDPVPVTPEKFLTFDHYVETVLENEEDWVKETKQYWMYAHRKRALR